MLKKKKNFLIHITMIPPATTIGPQTGSVTLKTTDKQKKKEIKRNNLQLIRPKLGKKKKEMIKIRKKK